METAQRIECQWCRSQNLSTARTCDTCGAPLDVRNLVSDSGWREAPRPHGAPLGDLALLGSWGERYLWIRLHGPGRIAIQSAPDHFHDPGSNLSRTSPATVWRW
jgi:hypothetical protein